MSAQLISTSADGVKTYRDSNGDIVQEGHVFRGLAAAGGEAFVSDSEETSEDEIHHHHGPAYIPSAEKKSKKEKKEKKEKKSKKSKKERSGSSSSGHACTCSHTH
ncbi:hypothetical protein TWF730_011034 [Orbilia blumenaviensis]|uniref:Uncharacterized protein n=1 Tax=Orbilia blumenaviensis TaxID=1796055 RepID=A0AAV9UK76_9PEZI